MKPCANILKDKRQNHGILEIGVRSAFDLTWIRFCKFTFIPDHDVRSHCKMKPGCGKGKKGGNNSPMSTERNDALFSIHLFLMADCLFFKINLTKVTL